MHVRRWLSIPLALLAIAAAGCGDDKDTKDGTSTAATTETAASTTTSTTAAIDPATQAKIDKLAAAAGTNLDKAPKLITTSGAPPEQLVKKDLVEGKGATAKLNKDQEVRVRYTLKVWDGKKIQSSWDDGKTAVPFLMADNAGLLNAWIQGVPGMKVGGRRLLVVPPELGYGTEGEPARPGAVAVPPDSTLVFVVDMVGIDKAP